MEKKEQLVIILPEHLADLPIRIVRSSNHQELPFTLLNLDEETLYGHKEEEKYLFIWRKDDYLKVAADEIVWIEADGSYTNIYLTDGRAMTLSFHLAFIEKELPPGDFLRIHRSRIVNLRHVISLMGNSLKIGDKMLVIGREYRERLLARFAFLGVRRRKGGKQDLRP